MKVGCCVGRERINGWYIGFTKVTMHVLKENWRKKKKLLGKKKSIRLYSMFCLIPVS